MSSRFELAGTSQTLLGALKAVGAEISWSQQAIRVFDLIVTGHTLYNDTEEVTRAVYNLMLKVKEFEKFIVLDLECHLALRNGKRPFLLHKAAQLLERVVDGCQTLTASGSKHPGPWPDRNWDHLTAEIQASFTEFGFCTAMDAIYDVDEAAKKLSVLSLKLNRIETAGKDMNIGVTLTELQAAESDCNGMQQSMTSSNVDKLKASFDKTQQRITHLETNLCASKLQPASDLFIQYLAGQHLLRKGFVGSMYHAENANIIARHVIHPGTRGWFLERFSRWLENNQKRLFILTGKQGSGKTALASTLCKLYSRKLIGSHFFDSSQGARSWTNKLNGMIQGLAHDFCHTLPEYLNYLDDKLGSANIGQLLTKDWQENYKTLLKEPLETLYGAGESKDRRYVVIIDGLDECDSDDWQDLRSFIMCFVKDLSARFCLFTTVRSRSFNAIIPVLSSADRDMAEGVRFEDKVWVNRHIKDIEVYLSTSLGAILSGEEDTELPQHAKADVMTLQKTIDELLKNSSGRFDYAVELMASFAQEMSTSGQFLSSMKKAIAPVQRNHASNYEQKMGDFASPYRAYRDKEGRSVDVRVMRQSHYLMDKTRVALIRGRHRVPDINQNGQ